MKRYDLNCDLVSLYESEDGEWVEWTDAEQLRAENAKLRKRLAETESALITITKQWLELIKKRDESTTYA